MSDLAKVYRLITKSWKEISGSLLLGQVLGAWIIPLMAQSYGESLANPITSLYSFISLYLIPFYLLALLYSPAVKVWSRYRRNYTLPAPPITLLDLIGLTVISAVWAAYLARSEWIPQIKVAQSWETWALVVGIASIILALTVYRKEWAMRVKVPLSAGIQTEDYFADEPIDDESRDLLFRGKFVEGLYRQVTSYPFPESFVFGLYGEWGEGKTSIVNMLRNKLLTRNDLLVYEFDPWVYSSTQALIQKFYEGLYRTLNTNYFLLNKRGLFKRYATLLASGLHLKGIKLDFPWLDESPEELREKIEALIAGCGRKIVIIIDDIDRLNDRSDILEVFKLVKLSGRFKNTVYILSFDPHKVNELIGDKSGDAQAYLDKIIQAPVHLPAADQACIDRYLYYSVSQNQLSAIDRLFTKLEIDSTRIKEFEQEFNLVYNKNLSRLVLNLRLAKKYLNSLYHSLPPIKDEVNLQDFIILEAIKVFAPDLYRDIHRYRWFYIPPWNLVASLGFPYELQKDDDAKYASIKKHVEQVVAGQAHPDVLLELLKTLFFQVKSAFQERGRIGQDGMSDTFRKEKRITHPDVFEKYFTLSVPPDELPDKVVESLIAELTVRDGDSLNEKLTDVVTDFQERKQLIKLLERLSLLAPTLDQRLARALVPFLYKQIHRFQVGEGGLFVRSEYDEAVSLLFQLINEKLDGSEIESTLVSVLTETPSIELAVRVVDLIRRRRGQAFKIYEHANLSTLLPMLTSRLKRHFIAEERNIFQEEKRYTYILHQWGISSPEAREVVNHYFFGLVRDNRRLLGKIIRSYTHFWGKSREIEVRRANLAEVYDEERLAAEIKMDIDTAYSDEEERGAVLAFIKQGDESNRRASLDSTKKAEKIAYLDASRKAQQLFREGYHEKALEELDKALAFTNWEDEYQWREQAKLLRWQVLLEVAHKNHGELQLKYLNEARKMASTEAKINELILNAYPKDRPDQAPIDFYYCLFYYLLWNNSTNDQRGEVERMFKTHHTIVTGSASSGEKDQLLGRCDEMKIKMNLK